MSEERRRRALEDLEKAVAGIAKLAGRVEQGVVPRKALSEELRAMYGTFSILLRALR